MLRLGGFASPSYIAVFRGLQTLFRRQGIDLDWVLYSTWDALVDAFVKGEVDLAWNGPLAYVKIRRRVEQPCRVVAMRDVDVDLVTHFITRPDSGISTPIDLKGKRFAFGGRGSVETGLLAHHFLKQEGVDPERDLAASTFYEERKPIGLSGERDVIERVRQGEYDAGAVSGPTLAALEAEGGSTRGQHPDFLVQSRLQPLLLYRAGQPRRRPAPEDHRRPCLGGPGRPDRRRRAHQGALPSFCSGHHRGMGHSRRGGREAEPYLINCLAWNLLLVALRARRNSRHRSVW